MKDLTSIPEKYHPLFTTDWNQGSNSKMTSLERGEMSQLFLEYMRWEVKHNLAPEEPEKELIVGFIKD